MEEKRELDSLFAFCMVFVYCLICCGYVWFINTFMSHRLSEESVSIPYWKQVANVYLAAWLPILLVMALIWGILEIGADIEYLIKSNKKKK